ncbi:hypothetical protein [Alloyangia pacifica]|uniref:Uncharacterized protein n=1 Tax=Alloyangia pacifica TaxID=311180 RepID=A0A1I6PP87_9RHOB|nr:hypothetical protein [Alloyangia pacifica]SDG32345.1 hypothetical protein SAMN04488245_102368 [Alloyangia pacifica]SFS41865.1 hypothetical protein SAMN04488050_101669 [Alloyangia pacifica]
MHPKATTDTLIEIILTTPEELVFWNDQLLDDVAVVLQARCAERDDPHITRPAAILNLLRSAALAHMRKDGPRPPDVPNARAWLSEFFPDVPDEVEVAAACLKLAVTTSPRARRSV